MPRYRCIDHGGTLDVPARKQRVGYTQTQVSVRPGLKRCYVVPERLLGMPIQKGGISQGARM
jgi:hypothetical protein